MRRLVERWRSRRRLSRDVSVWYHPKYAAPGLRKSARVKDLDPKRGELVLTRLVQDGLLRARDVRPAPRATFRQLTRFHSQAYLEAVASAEQLAPIFGLTAEDVDVDVMLDAARRAVGGTVAAAKSAIAARGIAINFGGGFHHAEPDRGSGFCVYNDVGIAIEELRATGWAGRIAIIDLDYHQGNGNSAAFENDDDVLVFSVHGSVWRHSDVPSHEIHLEGPVDDDRYLASLRRYLGPAIENFRPKLVFYIAGMDVLGVDALGTFGLTLQGVFERDRLVLDRCRRMKVATVVTMAGGYSDDAWIAFYNLARYALSGRPRVWRPRAPDLRARFGAIAAAIDPIDLTRSHDLSDDAFADDVLDDLVGVRRATKLLGYYSRHGVEVALERYGLLDVVRERGYRALEVEVDPADPARQVVRVFGKRHERGERLLLVELVVRKRIWPAPYDEAVQLSMLEVMWLLMQDPSLPFSLERQPLPGQEHPGLGIAAPMRELLVRAVRRLNLAGLIDRPSHYHNAVVTADDYRFVDPREEGCFRALMAALVDLPMAAATKMVDEGEVRWSDGRTFVWQPGDHVLPIDENLVAHFESKPYLDAVEAARAAASFRLA